MAIHLNQSKSFSLTLKNITAFKQNFEFRIDSIIKDLFEKYADTFDFMEYQIIHGIKLTGDDADVVLSDEEIFNIVRDWSVLPQNATPYLDITMRIDFDSNHSQNNITIGGISKPRHHYINPHQLLHNIVAIRIIDTKDIHDYFSIEVSPGEKIRILID